MAQLFSESGSVSNISVNSPTLSGSFVPGIDNAGASGGLGLVNPWGSGATTKNYSTYYTSDSDSALLGALTASTSSIGGTFSYDIEGIQGEQGPMGPQGEPGITTIQQIIVGASGDSSSIIATLEAWNAAEDTIPYGAESHIEWEEGWTKMDVAGVRTWNDAAIDEDGSFMLLASDSGLYISVDSGDTWTLSEPSAGSFIGAAVSDTDGNAVALEEDGADYGKFWKSENSGSTWTEITLSTT